MRKILALLYAFSSDCNKPVRDEVLIPEEGVFLADVGSFGNLELGLAWFREATSATPVGVLS
jgi:hypothetical protein